MDNSDWTRNGDYHPSRWEAQVEAANLIAESKCEKNPENGIGIISMGGKRVDVHVTSTNDLVRILNAIKEIHLSGECDFITSLNISILTLKHRANKNQKQRIIFFVGSPIKHSADDLVATGKKLKKYNIAVDIISFGNVDENKDLLTHFLNAVNNSNNSSILEVPVGYYIMDSLFSSTIINEAGPFDDMAVEGNHGMVNNAGEGEAQRQNNINQGGVGMSQFERDINMAIQASLNEENKKKEDANAGAKTDKPKANNDNVEMNATTEELEQARLLSFKR